jgi:hypothetical protein
VIVRSGPQYEQAREQCVIELVGSQANQWASGNQEAKPGQRRLLGHCDREHAERSAQVHHQPRWKRRLRRLAVEPLELLRG